MDSETRPIVTNGRWNTSLSTLEKEVIRIFRDSPAVLPINEHLLALVILYRYAGVVCPTKRSAVQLTRTNPTPRVTRECRRVVTLLGSTTDLSTTPYKQQTSTTR